MTEHRLAIPLCLNEIRQVLNQDATNRYVEDHGKACLSCFVPPLEEEHFPRNDQPTSVSAAQNL